MILPLLAPFQSISLCILSHHDLARCCTCRLSAVLPAGLVLLGTPALRCSTPYSVGTCPGIQNMLQCWRPITDKEKKDMFLFSSSLASLAFESRRCPLAFEVAPLAAAGHAFAPLRQTAAAPPCSATAYAPPSPAGRRACPDLLRLAQRLSEAADQASSLQQCRRAAPLWPLADWLSIWNCKVLTLILCKF
jgi:hypothetical protein